jgi:spore germination cell wall hydrolase CwlJ-like protein
MKGTLEFVIESARAVMASLAMSYEIETGNSVNETELKCMAENIYFEGRAEPMIGKVAIGKVVMNRIKSDRHPNDICGVVHEGPHRESWKTRGKDVKDEERKFYPIRNKCDFSWYCDGKKDIVWVSYMDGTQIDANATAWRDSVNVALFVMTGELRDVTNGADHYYNYNISNPYWAPLMIETAVIGNHRFMKEKK